MTLAYIDQMYRSYGSTDPVAARMVVSLDCSARHLLDGPATVKTRRIRVARAVKSLIGQPSTESPREGDVTIPGFGNGTIRGWQKFIARHGLWLHNGWQTPREVMHSEGASVY